MSSETGDRYLSSGLVISADFRKIAETGGPLMVGRAILLMFAVVCGGVAHAQTPTPAPQTCDVDGPEDFRSTVVRHAHYEFGLTSKFKGLVHGIDPRFGRITYRGVPDLVQTLSSQAPGQIVRRLSARLALLSGASPQAPSGSSTAALVYDFERGADMRITHTCVWLFDAQGLVLARKAPLAALPSQTILSAMGISSRAARYARLRTSVASPPLTPAELEAVIARSNAALAETSAQLLPADVAAAIEQRNFRRLLILPVVDFGTVPFAALPLAPGRVLGNQAAVVVLPQVTTLLEQSGNTVFRFQWPEGPDGALVVGNPDLSRDQSYLFQPLPHAENEARFVAEQFGVTALTGRSATLSSVKSSLNLQAHAPTAGYRVLYFATHGVTDPEHPFTRSFVGLTGGRLLGDDVKRVLLFNRPLVVLSACQTANGRVFEGGAYGLVRSWYYAGAGQVVGSLWNVDDGATDRLMREFVTRLRSDPRPEFALQSAMRAAPDADRADPALWSAFIVFGNPSYAGR